VVIRDGTSTTKMVWVDVGYGGGCSCGLYGSNEHTIGIDMLGSGSRAGAVELIWHSSRPYPTTQSKIVSISRALNIGSATKYTVDYSKIIFMGQR